MKTEQIETPIETMIRVKAERGIMTEEKILYKAKFIKNIENLRTEHNLKVCDRRESYAERLAQFEASQPKPEQTRERLKRLSNNIAYLRNRNQIAQVNAMAGG